MSTRGFVTIVKGKDVQSVGYLSSDAYLSYYGTEILKAMSAVMIGSFIKSLNKEGDPSDCDGFKLNWICPDKESRAIGDWDYSEYGYIYDIKKDVLKVYHYGKTLFTIERDDIPKYMYLFEHDWEIYHAMAYDPEQLSDVGEWEKMMKRAVTCSIAQLKSYVTKAQKERIYLSDTHCIVAGHRPGNEMYKKELTSSKLSYGLEFIVEHDDFSKGWSVFLQTPFIRVRCIRGNQKYGEFSSEKAAVQAIRDLIRSYGKARIFRLAEIFEEIKDALSTLKVNKDASRARALAASLDGKWNTALWWTPSDDLTVEGLKSDFHAAICRG